MERALANFMLDLHSAEFGYTEVIPPALVKDDAVYGTGQLPKFQKNFHLTMDIGLSDCRSSATSLVAGDILRQDDLPLRYTAWTPAFVQKQGLPGRIRAE